jgi:hypothetical protein
VLNDKTVLLEVAGFEHSRTDFAGRVQKVLGQLGNSVPELTSGVLAISRLVHEVCALAADLYQPKYRLL